MNKGPAPKTALHNAAKEEYGAVAASPPDLPPGFDPALYLAINADVAAAGADPVQHYMNWGRAELRSLRDLGKGLDHPGSRLMDEAERMVWQKALRRRVAAEGSLMAVVSGHPRAAWLRSGFSLGAWLAQNQDVAQALQDPLEGAFHYLEFGLEEGREDRPMTWDSGFVAARYGLDLDPDTITATAALAAVLAQGVSPLEVALDEAQAWELAGLCGSVLADRFDHEFYHAIANRAGGTDATALPASHSRADCIAHFLAHGIGQVTMMHPDYVFDAAFYAEQLLPDDLRAFELAPAPAKGAAAADDRARAAAPALYRHWLGHGLRNGLASDPLSWAKRHFGIRLPDTLFAQLGVYRLAANLDPKSGRLAVLQHLLQSPRPTASALNLDAPGMARLLVDLTLRAERAGRVEDAEWLGWLALTGTIGTQDGALRLLLAGLLQNRGKLEPARWLRTTVALEHVTGWDLLNQAEALMFCQQYEAAFAQLSAIGDKARGGDNFLSDVAIVRHKRTLAHQGFDRIWNSIGPHVAAHGIARTQNQLRAALTACTPEFSSAQHAREIRHVALIGNEDLYQCKLYRVDQKAEQLRSAGYMVSVLSPARDLGAFVAEIDSYDAVIFFRVPAFPTMIEAMVSAAEHGLLTFYEIDDVVFDPAHFPPPLETYAGQITAEQHASMAVGVPLFEHAMRLCDYGIASTATIARLMEPLVRKGRVYEHHNALGQMHKAALRAPVPPRTPDAPLVLFYGSGTKAHKEDFHDILEPALAEILRRHPGRVQIRLIGHFGTFTHLNPGTDPVEIREPVWDFEEFCALVAQADINLSVLVPTLVTDAKSEIKWMEAAMFGIPSVVSATATHREVIADGKTGFLASSTADFVVAMDRLISDAALRVQVGAAAQAQVMADYAIPAMGASLRTIFESLRPVGPPRRRLMVVNVYFPPQTFGGATRVVADNIADLRAQYGDTYDIDVVATLEGGTTPLETACHAVDGVRVWTITAPPQPEGDMTARDPRMADVFDRLVGRLRPDLIHFHCIQRLTASVVDVARLRDIPYVITLHDGWWISPNQFILNDRGKAEYYDYRLQDRPGFPDRAKMLARPLRGAARLLAVSEPFAELHRACGLANVEVVENGVSDLPPCVRRPSASGRVRLAHIGGASRHKGYHLLRYALLANAYRNLELLVIDHALAPGERHEEIWGTTPVTFAPKVPQSKVTELYRDVDILLAPSIWPESYGLVTREAIACKVWVIASDQGAIGADVIEGVNGHRVGIDSYAGLAEALWKVDRTPARYLGSPGAARPPRPARAQVEALHTLFARILADRGAG